MGAVLMHPSVKRNASKYSHLLGASPAKTGDCGTCESQEMERDSAAWLLGLVKNLQDAGNVLIEYMDSNRDEARAAGVEAVVIELTAIFEGGKLEKIRESLEESSADSAKASVSLEGLSKIRRVERLVRDAQTSLARVSGWTPSQKVEGGRAAIGQTSSSSSILTGNAPIIFGIVFGLVVVVSVSILAFRSKSSTEGAAYSGS